MNTLRKLGKWIGGTLLAMTVIFLMIYLFIAYMINGRIDKRYAFKTEQVVIPQDGATLARGEHLALIKGCVECHGEKLSGKVLVDNFPLGRLSSSNLTWGQGGRPTDYSTSDWLMALRHGVDRSGRPLLYMPSHETTVLAKSDLQALIAYCQHLRPVDNQLPANQLGPVVKLLTYVGKMPLLPVEQIDHNRPMVVQADTLEGIAQGKYLAVSCIGCHQPSMKGGKPTLPGGSRIADLTRSGATGRWTKEQFIRTLRTGKTPTGHQLNNNEMPWKMTAQYTDSELKSLYQYLHSLR
ncbi:c-type cytochrome [Spirosoma sp. HMF4905]|uniref:C-type cytochrome n=1 Tax=Spirosoma arboris TaxID=2682092 RepID=A0A7K1SJ49_9BACT|nr:c-type cytochrome [Spirosoma arboris]MVM33841.1 c-type cytochrome [Spirosoma arboris]